MDLMAVYEKYVGSEVVMKRHDPYGLRDREKHPEKSDIGFVGRVVKVVEVEEDAHLPPYAVLLVKNEAGRELDLSDWELGIKEKEAIAAYRQARLEWELKIGGAK
jgi:hypothetical protein